VYFKPPAAIVRAGYVQNARTEILAYKPRASEEYRLHRNFNLSAGRLWDLRVKQ
jgi:hypothetical protein